MDTIQTEVDVVQKGEIVKKEVELEYNEGDLEVEVLYNGVCKSDVKVYYGKDAFIGDAYSGHEGVGKVLSSKCDVFVKGDIVTTCWHPCFTKHSIWKGSKCIKIPYAVHKFCLQPVACIVEVFQSLVGIGKMRNIENILVLGSGYFASLIDMIRKSREAYDLGLIEGEINWSFYGHYNMDKFGKDRVYDILSGSYDVIIDVSGKYPGINVSLLKEGGCYIVVANNNGDISINSFMASWKNISVFFPSPRSKSFMESMLLTKLLVEGSLGDVLDEMYYVISSLELEQYMKDYRLYAKVIVKY